MHPNGYTKEMIKELLGSSWPTIDPDHETGNEMRKRKGREMRAGKRPYPVYNAKKTGICTNIGKHPDIGFTFSFL